MMAARSPLHLLLGVLGTARVVLSAAGGARVVAVAVGNTLVAPFLAHVVGQGQGVFGDVGLLAVTADTAVGESFLEHHISDHADISNK